MSESDREASIYCLSRVVEHFHAEGNKGLAHLARWVMEALIRGRSVQAVAQMERERGLDRPACANEEGKTWR